jgi:ribonuclease-3
MEQVLEQVEQIIGYKFNDRNLLKTAFTHASASESRFLSNERLEFLGDAVLGVIICRAIFEQFPAYLEGDLTKIKSMLVSRRTCARVAKQLGLHKLLRVGKGMAASRALSGSIAAAVLEAVIAAIYIDGGLEAARGFIHRCFSELIDRTNAEQDHGNFKSMLQQYAQQRLNATPVYELLDEKGPDHNKCFESEVIINKRHFPSAWGTNKKQAEQKAAFNALVELGILEQMILDSEHI